ncbi:MAG: glycosyltransferase 87 family protein [Chloroflexota bacterium]|nr:glycosyltransferase 87 family protein [Chloroflexota bacterium]
MYRGTPPGAGFDLELLIAGGRHIAAGESPYSPAMLAGRSVEITTLFYTYPPLVAQAFSLLAAVPSPVIFGGAMIAASISAVTVGAAVAGAAGSRALARAAVLPLAALLPLWFPFTVGMLFGNLDIFFPALYGLVLVAALRPRDAGPSRRWLVGGGVALAAASVTKLHPAVLGVWFVVRGAVELRRVEDLVRIGSVRVPSSWVVAGVAVLVTAVVFAVSLIAGGTGPWLEYVTVLRAGASVDLLDPRNLGPAVQLVMLLGLGPGAVGPLQVAVLVVALVVTVISAIRVDDPLESLTWAALASFIVLPVTWFHHFAALIPFGIAAVARAWSLDARTRRRVLILVAASFAIGFIGFGMPPTWLLAPVVLAMARLSRPTEQRPG